MTHLILLLLSLSFIELSDAADTCIFDGNRTTCYSLRPNSSNWSSAQSYCQQQLNGRLAVIGNQTIQTRLRSMHLTAGISVWIGARQDEPGNSSSSSSSSSHAQFDWRWVNEKVPPTQSDWSPNQPNNSTGFYWCAAVDRTVGGLYDDQLCNMTYGYVCHVGSSGSCRNNSGRAYYVFGEKCVFPSTINDTWYRARAHCIQLQGDLLTLSSSNETTGLAKFLQDSNFRGRFVWIGLYRNPFYWENGSGVSQLMTWNYFAVQNPRPLGGSKQLLCVYIETPGRTFQWMTGDCSQNLYFLCQYTLSVTPTTTTTNRISSKAADAMTTSANSIMTSGVVMPRAVMTTATDTIMTSEISHSAQGNEPSSSSETLSSSSFESNRSSPATTMTPEASRSTTKAAESDLSSPMVIVLAVSVSVGLLFLVVAVITLVCHLARRKYHHKIYSSPNEPKSIDRVHDVRSKATIPESMGVRSLRHIFVEDYHLTKSINAIEII